MRSSAQLASDPALLEALFSRIPDVVFFVKDQQGRYVLVNDALLERCGVAHKRALLGRTAEDVFPAPLGASYLAQDREVLETGVEIRDKLELHLYPGGSQGWCLTFKTPLRDVGGRVNGLAGISRDLHRPDEHHPEYERLAQAVDTVHTRYDEPLKLEALARTVGLSMDRFERLVKQVFHLTPRQLLTKTRIDAASRLLQEGGASVAEIAHRCGYSDHSAFTRQFKATVGIAPVAFRERAARSAGRSGLP
jgi:PAS domain S-box-containing protein